MRGDPPQLLDKLLCLNYFIEEKQVLGFGYYFTAEKQANKHKTGEDVFQRGRELGH